MPVRGADVVAQNIRSFGGGFLAHVNKTMHVVDKLLDDEITRNMNLDCHTQADLDAMGNPYSRRHGPQGAKIHDPYWQVHTQTGNLISSKRAGISEASVASGTLKAGAWVALDTSVAEYANDVIYGNSFMIPRDFMNGSLAIVKDSAVEYIQESLRDFVYSFKPKQQ